MKPFDYVAWTLAGAFLSAMVQAIGYLIFLATDSMMAAWAAGWVVAAITLLYMEYTSRAT